MKRLTILTLPLAFLAAGCESESIVDYPTATVVETVEVTQEPDVVEVTVTETVDEALSTNRYGPEGNISSIYYTYGLQAEILECYQTEDGIHIRGSVKSDIEQMVDVSGTVQAIDGLDLILGRGGVYLPQMRPGDEIGFNSFIEGARADEFTCSVNILESTPSFVEEDVNGEDIFGNG